MMRINLDGKQGACQLIHSHASSPKHRLTVSLRRLLIVGLCIWIPMTHAEHSLQPSRLLPAALIEPQTAYQHEPLVVRAALPAHSPGVAHPGVPRPFSDALHLLLSVEPGETLWAIGKRYGVKVQRLVHYNQLLNPHQIRAGDTLVVPLFQLPLIWPVTGIISSQFGPRGHRLHAGIDIAAPRGTPVRAAADGRVMVSGIQRGYGRVIWLRHAGGYVTVYAHHQVNHVTKGQWVRQGQEIAQVGISGRTTGPHLHFEMHDTSGAQDPMPYLPPRPTRIVLAQVDVSQ